MILRISRALRRDRAEADELLEGELVALELADGERGPVDRQRRHDDVDARAVGQARVADRRGFVDPAADLADDALADVEQLVVVAEADRGALDLAGDFDVDGAGAVHHDVGDVVAREQRLERPVAEHVVADVVEQLLLLGDRHHDVLDRDDLVDDVADFLARRVGVELGELGEIDRLDQGAEDRALDLVIAVRFARVGRRGRRRWADGWRRRRARPAAPAPARAAPRARPTETRCARRRPTRPASAAPAPSAPGVRRGAARWRAAGLASRNRTLTEHEVTLRSAHSRIYGSSFTAAASRAAARAGRCAPSWPRPGRSAPARAGGTFRRSGGRPPPRRSSGRCWTPSRTPAARTE